MANKSSIQIGVMLLFVFSGLALNPGALAATVAVVSKQANGKVELFDTTTGSLLHSIDVGSSPHEIAVSPNTIHAAVSNYGDEVLGNSVSIIDLSEGRLANTITLSKHLAPHGIAWKDNSSFVVTAENTQAIFLLMFSPG